MIFTCHHCHGSQSRLSSICPGSGLIRYIRLLLLITLYKVNDDSPWIVCATLEKTAIHHSEVTELYVWLLLLLDKLMMTAPRWCLQHYWKLLPKYQRTGLLLLLLLMYREHFTLVPLLQDLPKWRLALYCSILSCRVADISLLLLLLLQLLPLLSSLSTG